MEVNLRILQILQQNDKEASGSTLNNWSDGSIWMQILEAGESQSQKATIFNILEYMGAWDWYNKQVKLSPGHNLHEKE
jgi:hypothetical protein